MLQNSNLIRFAGAKLPFETCDDVRIELLLIATCRYWSLAGGSNLARRNPYLQIFILVNGPVFINSNKLHCTDGSENLGDKLS